MGSPLRIEDENGLTRETYGYGAFGEDLYGNQGVLQVFGYTGYQRDRVAGTYYAQAREYQAEVGRFAGQDLIAGFMDMPLSMNRYSYCFNAPMMLVDPDGAWPSLEDIGNTIDNGIQAVKDRVSNVARWCHDEIWSKHIYGENQILYERKIDGMNYEVTSHRGGNLIVVKRNRRGEFVGWLLNASISLPGGISIGQQLSGKSWSPQTWKYSNTVKCTNAGGLTTIYGGYVNLEGIGVHFGTSGTTGTLPLPLPDGTEIENYAAVSWRLSEDIQMVSWKQIFEIVTSTALVALALVLVADDLTGWGAVDDPILVLIMDYLVTVMPNVVQTLQNLIPQLELCSV